MDVDPVDAFPPRIERDVLRWVGLGKVGKRAQLTDDTFAHLVELRRGFGEDVRRQDALQRVPQRCVCAEPVRGLWGVLKERVHVVMVSCARQRRLMSTVRIDKPNDDIAIVTMNRPEVLNAMSVELCDDLLAALDSVGK